MKAELFNFSCWINIDDPERLKEVGKQLLEESEFEILNFMEHHFQPFGFTCIWLLAESHLAIHSFPEENKSYVELTSCIEHKKNVFMNQLKKRKLIDSIDTPISEAANK